MKIDKLPRVQQSLLSHHVSEILMPAMHPTPNLVCSSCGKPHSGLDYGNPWCSECLRAQGFLPHGYDSKAMWIVFRPLFSYLSGIGAWESLQGLVWRVDREGERVLRGLTLQQLNTGAYPDFVGCAMCGAELGEGAVKEFCSRTCYGRWYRRENSHELSNKRKEAARLRKEKNEARKAQKSPD